MLRFCFTITIALSILFVNGLSQFDLLLSFPKGQTCGNDLQFTKNSQTVLTVTENGTCICNYFSGDGTQLNLNNQTTISKLLKPVLFKAVRSSALTFTSGYTPLIYNTSLIDTNNAYNITSGIYTFPESGKYFVHSSISIQIGTSQGYSAGVNVFVNTTCPAGVRTANGGSNGVTSMYDPVVSVEVNTLLWVNQGDQLAVCLYLSTNSDKQMYPDGALNEIHLFKVSS